MIDMVGTFAHNIHIKLQAILILKLKIEKEVKNNSKFRELKLGLIQKCLKHTV